jgi:hypothetical protein
MEPQTGTAPASQLHALLEKYLESKTAGDVDATMAYFSPDMITYTDATLGWNFDSYAAVKAGFEQYMPSWVPPARSYATKILAGGQSALVHLVGTPEMFGSEVRAVSAVDFTGGKIVRQVDYWDSSAFDAGLYRQFRTSADRFPRDLKDTRVVTTAPTELARAATALQEAFAAADASAAAGRIETTHYLERVLGRVPYGQASTLRHVVGGRDGGGFEWTAGPDADHLAGITELVLDPHGLITAITSVYDSRQIDPVSKRSLLEATLA